MVAVRVASTAAEARREEQPGAAQVASWAAGLQVAEQGATAAVGTSVVAVAAWVERRAAAERWAEQEAEEMKAVRAEAAGTKAVPWGGAEAILAMVGWPEAAAAVVVGARAVAEMAGQVEEVQMVVVRLVVVVGPGWAEMVVRAEACAEVVAISVRGARTVPDARGIPAWLELAPSCWARYSKSKSKSKLDRLRDVRRPQSLA